MTMRTWQDSPKTTLRVGSLGSGELVITSAATLYFNAQTNGHNRPEVGLTVRGVRYLVSAHFARVEHGDEIFWDFVGTTDYEKRRHLYLSRAGTFEGSDKVSEPARRTIEAMLLDAVRAWGQDAASQPLLRAGEDREINNLLMRNAEALADAEATVAALRKERAALREREQALGVLT